MPVAVLPRTGAITLLQMDGSLTKEQYAKGMQMIIESGKIISKIQQDAIKAPYLKAEEKYR